jgi:hypothetical protein
VGEGATSDSAVESRITLNIAVSVARKLIIMLLLRTAPEDLPYSLGLMNRIIFLYLVSGLVVQSELVESSLSISRMILNLAITLLFTYVVLSALELKARFVQTMSALVGIGIVFNLLAWPLLKQLGEEASPVPAAGILSLLVLLLMSWELIVTAHIYRHALNIKMGQGIILALGLFFISIMLSQMIFPES